MLSLQQYHSYLQEGTTKMSTNEVRNEMQKLSKYSFHTQYDSMDDPFLSYHFEFYP